MTERILGPTGSRRKRLGLIGPLAALAAFVGLFAASAAVALPAAACTTLNHLSGSAFEIDVNANLKVDGAAADCIDWNSVADLSKPDVATGSGDDAFGQGTAENNPNPTIVTGSIPPNKSDLKRFGTYTESNANGKFLELYWARVQNPSGTTNMDFELNQLACDGTAANCAQNGSSKNPIYVTPKRTEGDKLITYDLSKGGTLPSISIREWNGTVWGPEDVISGAGGDALGAVNTTDIVVADSEIGALSAFTFGEVAIDFDAIFGANDCGSFGSVYLKSRSSDSFTSELKDFIAPEDVFISNCAGIVTNAVATGNVGDNIHDTATLSDVTEHAGGSITFSLYGPSDTADCSGTAIFTSTNSAIDGPGDYLSGDFPTTAPGTYYWIAEYSGDGNNSRASTACGDANESSVISKPDSTISTAQVLVPNDSATVGGGGTLDGTATFSLFKPGQTCSESSSDTPVFTVAISVDGDSGTSVSTVNTANTDTLAGSHADALGTWKWLVTYDGDSTHNDSVSDCTETFTIAE